ncbi:hypothetical protein GMD78_14625 [Ornithinibacillus sp. L9]|uniref:YwdI n=1 Tax=Ornithinibacillus caprae TaxID=2678566 RepID=A0A6N8FJ17_9BACI|nr:YwdI family protein [Ornithinibacillus caprae]MUK89600.1 hypothetical protein [Ornithinibacillus caprae]
MAIADETIIQKMIDELQKAKQEKSHTKMLNHIEHVRLLSDLFVTTDYEPTKKVQKEEISEAEMKAMLGESKKQPSYRKTTDLDEDDANGNSIFDF